MAAASCVLNKSVCVVFFLFAIREMERERQDVKKSAVPESGGRRSYMCETEGCKDFSQYKKSTI